MKVKQFLKSFDAFAKKKQSNEDGSFSFEKIVIFAKNKDDGLEYGFSTKSMIDSSDGGLALLLEKREPSAGNDPYFNKEIKADDWILYPSNVYNSAKRYENSEFRAQLPGHKIMKVKDVKFKMVNDVCQIWLVLF